MRLATSTCNPAYHKTSTNYGPAASLALCCAQLQCVLVAHPHSRSIAPNRPMFAQRQQYGDDSALLQTHQFFANFNTNSNRALATVSRTFCRPRLPAFEHFEVQIKLSPQCCALFVDPFPTSRPELAEANASLQRPREPLYPEKHGFRAQECFHLRIHAFRNYYSALLLPQRTALAYNVVDMMMTWRQDCPWTFVRSAEVFELNSIWWHALRYTACIRKFYMSQQWFHWWLDLHFHMYRSIA